LATDRLIESDATAHRDQPEIHHRRSRSILDRARHRILRVGLRVALTTVGWHRDESPPDQFLTEQFSFVVVRVVYQAVILNPRADSFFNPNFFAPR
jgi:hypothetical protein